MNDKLKELIEEEIKRAVDKHGNFNSPHEAHSVLREEIEEVEEEMSLIKRNMDNIWHSIRRNVFKNEHVSIELNVLENTSINLIMEAIQLSAMFKKLKEQQLKNEWK